MTADGPERRKDERIKCRLACVVHYSRKTVEGLIRDVSLGGLSLQTAAPLEQGESAQIVIPRAGVRAEISLQTIVWYGRTTSRRSSKDSLSVVGLVLSDAPESYVDLIESLRPGVSLASQRLSAEKARKKPTPVSSQPKGRDEGPKKEATSRGGANTGAPPCEKPKSPTTPKPKRFQVRVKMSTQPRTRSIMVFADAADEARELAKLEAGAGWIVLEVEARE